MIKLFKNIVIILGIFLLNTFGLVAHSNAMPMSDHGFESMSEDTGKEKSLTCVTLCRLATNDKEDGILIDKEEDDEPKPSHSIRPQTITRFDDQQYTTLVDSVIKPPPRASLYVLYGIFRS